MNHEFPIERLKALHTIQPDPVFLKWSKRAIFADARPAPRALPRYARTDILTFMFRALRPTAAIGAMAALALLVVAKTPAAQPAIASLNDVSIADERQAVVAEAKTGQVRYFKGISPTISLALTDIIDTSTDYGSANHIKKGIALLADNK